MTNVEEPQARAQQARIQYEVWCPQDGGVLDDLGAYYNPQDVHSAAARHNADFTPPHNAVGVVYVPPWDELLKPLTGDQVETLQKASLLVIGAREEAATLLARAGAADFSDDFFRSPCRSPRCVCPQYQGRDETTCERGSCRHSAAQHAT
ncbi:DUF6422 family protein [Streptomyces globosus]|uniref:DUF6422 family protein n=1 Tax=Streptomyces globosus TaxID=68209 RepID=UPI0013B40D21|nr:DUF6422 family protein [Streptomyces globosus]